MKRRIFKNPDRNFLICSPTYKILEQSTLPPFLAAMEGYGEYNYSKATFTTNWGGRVFCRTNTDPDSIVGITNVDGIWGDEAGKFTLYFWENIQGRASFMNCPIMLTTSPYTLNWIWKEIIKPKQQGQREDVALIQAASIENPYFNRSSYEAAQKTMDPRRFKMMYGGEWGRMAGLVYDCFEEDQNIVNPFELPQGTRCVAGIDWGYNPDPFVCVVRAITPTGHHFQVSEFYKTGMTLPDMVAYCQHIKRTWNIEKFYCDRSQPGSIEEFNRNRLTAFGADNDLNRGIGLHYELIATRRYKIFRGTSPHTLDELETYHYPEPEDLGPDEDSKEQKPVGQNDHCLDANRYITIESYHRGVKSGPYAPMDMTQLTSESRWRRLMQNKARIQRTEEWG